MIQNAYVSVICITPMHVNVQVVRNMLYGESTCWSCEVSGLRSHQDTMRDMRGNLAQQLIVMKLRQLVSPP